MKILHIGNLGPTKFPTGGIIHVDESIKLETLEGHISEWVSIRPQREIYAIKSKNHLRLNLQPDYPLTIFPDYYAGLYVADNNRALSFVQNKLESFEPDVVVYEGPWMWTLVQKLKPRLKFKFREIYSCHNIESTLLSRIYLEDKQSDFSVAIASRFLTKLEMEMSQCCDAVVTLTKDDSMAIGKFAPKKIIQASNGANANPPSNFSKLMSRLRRDLNSCRFIFISSNWAPHVDGLHNLIRVLEVSNALHDVELTVVGSIHESFQNYHRNRIYKIGSKISIRFTGRVGSKKLSSLQHSSHGYFLPIQYGGGKGIKASEALLSGKTIVATTAAFRGFDLNTLPNNVFIEPDYEAFADKLLNLKANELVLNTVATVQSDYSWESVLKPWIEYLRNLQPNDTTSHME